MPPVGDVTATVNLGRDRACVQRRNPLLSGTVLRKDASSRFYTAGGSLREGTAKWKWSEKGGGGRRRTHPRPNLLRPSPSSSDFLRPYFAFGSSPHHHIRPSGRGRGQTSFSVSPS